MKPGPNRLVFVLGMALAMAVTILTITTWARQDGAEPISPTMYRAQHLNLY